MSEEIRISKINILLQQGKYTEAEKLLKDLLTGDANNTAYLSLLAEVYLQQDKFPMAQQIIDNAIGLSPDQAYLFYIKSRIAIQQDKLQDAEQIIRQAIALDPYDADYFALLANILLARKQYNESLDYADQALAIDAENLLALNTRSTALLKLNKKAAAFTTIEGALREDPNNAYTHANYGWGLLEQGDHKKALEHFKEALKNDPNLAHAQSGMMEALKATNPVYRLFLRYAFFMGNLTAKYQWGVIVGLYLAMRGLRFIAAENESFRPFLIPVIVALALIAFSTWIITPISNLFLRFNRYGQMLLDRKEKMSSNFVAVSFFIFLVGITLYFVLKDQRFLSLAVFGFTMMLPFGVMFAPAKNKNALLIYAGIMTLVGIGAIGIIFTTGAMLNALSIIFLLGFIGYQWVANALLIKESNR